MRAMTLYRELLAAGWLDMIRPVARSRGKQGVDGHARYITWLAARYYVGLESLDALVRLAPERAVEIILRSR